MSILEGKSSPIEEANKLNISKEDISVFHKTFMDGGMKATAEKMKTYLLNIDFHGKE